METEEFQGSPLDFLCKQDELGEEVVGFRWSLKG